MTESYAIIRRFLFELAVTISLDKNSREPINSLFVSPISFYTNVLKTQKMLQFRNKKKFSTRKRLKTDREGNEGKEGKERKKGETEAEEGRKKEIELSVADQGLQGGKQRRTPVPILRFLG